MRRLLWTLPLFGCNEYQVTELSFDERFEQEDLSHVSDVLFVIDDSASMAEEQALLQLNFAQFVAVLEDTYAEFHLGVTTTSVSGDDAGELRGGILTSETPDFVNVATSALAVGTGGDRDEQGLAAAALAVDPANNPGFVREGAELNVVVFSDEDDHSPGAVEEYLYAYEDVAGVNNYAVHAIVGDLPEGCASGSTAADAGDRYLAAAVQTGGWRDSICAEDYTPILTRVGLDIAGLKDTFVLSRVPDPESIVVNVDDVVMPNREIDGWVYDAGENAIVFHGRAIPRPGMAIGVHYELLMGAEQG
jgi:hypothetical protein